MPSGEYLINFDHELYVGLATTTSPIPSSPTGLTKVFNLTDNSMTGASQTTSVLDYDSDPTSSKEAITQLSYSFPAVLNLSPGDPAYQILLTAYQQAVSNVAVQFWRISAKIGASTDDPEIRAGIATVGGFTEARGVGSVGTVTMNLAGFGNNVWYPQGRGLATLTLTSAGSGLVDATYNAVDLVNVAIGGRGGTADITVASNVVSGAPTIVAAGNNYRVGDVLTVDLADIGGAGVAPTFTVATVA